jgi:hypothetical protein
MDFDIHRFCIFGTEKGSVLAQEGTSGLPFFTLDVGPPSIITSVQCNDFNRP